MSSVQSFKAFLALILIVVPCYSSAQTAYVDQLVDRALNSGLANSPGWHALLHYKPGGLFHEWESQADDLAFFLAPSGKYRPGEELAATIRAMGEPVNNVNQHAQCRFPARYVWLKQQLEIDTQQMDEVHCIELGKWFDTIRPGTLTLVFPSAYINSPSSMFGHTLLRVNPDDHRKNLPLVAYALNYAANANDIDSALVFSIKGLIGGYPGIFSIVPYYEKIKEYSDLENRDVWEYELNFSGDEINQLMRHAWEVRDIQFDYFFLTENCSYHMLSLMEAVRPELDLTRHFDIKAIPADTVRAVAQAGLVSGYTYRPSSTTVLAQHAAQMSEADNDIVIALTNGERAVDDTVVTSKSPIEKARIYEQSYDYSRFLHTANPGERDTHAGTNWELLAARSQLDHLDAWSPVTEPDVRPENGHDTARIAYTIGTLEGDNYLGLRLRPAYHDILDPPAGYSPGAQINFMDLRLDYFADENAFRLNRFILINVLSLSPRTRYFSPISWGMNIGIDRVLTARGMTNAAALTVDGGVSTRLAGNWTGSILLEADIRSAKRYDESYTAGAGAVVNLLKQSDSLSFNSSYKSLAYRAGEETDRGEFDIELSYQMHRTSSIRLGFSRQHYYDVYRNRSEIGYYLYF